MAHPFDFDWALPTAPEDVPLPPGLEEQLADIHSLHPRARALAGLLVRCGQTHLFSEWVPGEDAEEKRRFFAQVEGLHEAYPGGLDGYAGRARRLLARSRVGVNPMDGWLPSVPEGLGTSLDPLSAEYCACEEAGLAEAAGLAFVLPAGGLGERLGFDGVKLALPSEIASGASVLAVYAGHILALQRLVAARLGRAVRMPFVIMTSQDTHAGTAELFAEHGHFGLEPSQVTLLLQQRVAALVDDDARFAAAGKYELLTKPHGHGDVHVLLHRAGLAARWLKEGRKWVMFFQDTSTLYFSTFLATLGVSARRQLDLNFACMPRRAGMALGVLATMTHADSGAVMRVAPVEYNQLQPLLKATGGKYAQGDANGADGYSPFPGNTNAIFAALPMYVAVLTRTGGMVPEFVNPKYKKGDGAGFQSPTRLECMMQDYARLLDEDAAVGFTSHPIEYGYFPCKNNLADAQALSAKGVPSYGAASSEMAVYAAHAAALRRLGAAVPVGVERSFHGVAVTQGPAVVFAPSFAPTMSELRRRFPTASAVRLTARSTLLVDGEDVTIDALELDGALEVRVCDGASLRIISLAVVNDGWSFDELSEAVLANAECPPLLRMRGYTLRKKQQRLIAIKRPGRYEVLDGNLRRIDGDGAARPVGGALEAGAPPPKEGRWSSTALSLSAGASVPVPLLLAEPSALHLSITPKGGGGLYVSVHPAQGEPVLPPRFVDADGWEGDVDVPGSGVFTVRLENRNRLAAVTVAAHLEHTPLGESAAAGRQRALEKSLRGRREELERIDRQDGGLAASEAELSARLWEVQETRRRHEASRTQLVAAISELEDELRRETDATGATDAKNGNGTV